MKPVKKFYAKIDSYNQTTYETNTLSVLLADETRLTLRIDESETVKEEEVYYFEAKPIEFKGREQYLVETYRHISACDIGLEEKIRIMREFYRFAPVDVSRSKQTVERYLAAIENPVVKTITDNLYEQYKEAFYLYPAATRFHHAYIGGVAHHTATMLTLSDGLVKTYPFLDHDLLISGILLHDLFKTVELSNYYAPEYTKEGRLLGHIVMGSEAIGETARKHGLYEEEERTLLQHMLLSHHYYGNFGSPKKPNIPEALALHFIDNIDSKFAVLGEALEEIEPGEFTSPLGVLDRERYYKAKRTKHRKK